jgi:hypothetical protein
MVAAPPLTIVGPILDTVVVSRNVTGMICEESGRHVDVSNGLY